MGQVRPSQPRSPSSRHERAPLRRVDDLRHVLAGQVEDVGVVVLVEELLDLLPRRRAARARTRNPCGSDPAPEPTSRWFATTAVSVQAMTPRVPQAGELVVVEAELALQHRRRCARRPTGTRVSGPSAIFDSFTGLPGTSTGSSTPSVRGISTSMLRAATCGSAITSDAWLLGPGDDAGRGELRARLRASCAVDAHASTAGRITVSRCGAQPARVAKRGSSFHSGWPTRSASAAELVLAHDLRDDVAVGRAEALADHLERLVGLGPHAQRPEVRDDVGHRDHRVEHRDVDVLALAGALAVAQRGEDADHAEQRRADVAERADRDRHRRLVRDGGSRRCPTSPRRSTRTRASRGTASRPCCRNPRSTRRSRAGARAAIVVVAETHAVHRAGLEVLGDHVEVRRRARGTARGPRATSGRCRRCACRSCCAGRSRRPCGPAGSSIAGVDAAARLAVHRDARPSRRRRRAGRAAASRTAAPASARPRARARRRAACRTRCARRVRHVAESHGDTVRSPRPTVGTPNQVLGNTSLGGFTFSGNHGVLPPHAMMRDVPGAASLPSGIVTFVFTDIEGSTRHLPAPRRPLPAVARTPQRAAPRRLVGVRRHRGEDPGRRVLRRVSTTRQPRSRRAFAPSNSLATEQWPHDATTARPHRRALRPRRAARAATTSRLPYTRRHASSPRRTAIKSLQRSPRWISSRRRVLSVSTRSAGSACATSRRQSSCTRCRGTAFGPSSPRSRATPGGRSQLDSPDCTVLRSGARALDARRMRDIRTARDCARTRAESGRLVSSPSSACGARRTGRAAPGSPHSRPLPIPAHLATAVATALGVAPRAGWRRRWRRCRSSSSCARSRSC